MEAEGAITIITNGIQRCFSRGKLIISTVACYVSAFIGMIKVKLIIFRDNLPHDGLIKRAYLLCILLTNGSIGLTTTKISHTAQAQIGVGNRGIPSEITFIILRLDVIELVVLQFCERRDLATRLCTQGVGHRDYTSVDYNISHITLYGNRSNLLGREELCSVDSASIECLNICIYDTTLTFEANDLNGVGLHLLHVTHDAHLTTAHILGRDSVGTIAIDFGVGHNHLNPVGVTLIVELFFGSHVIAILEAKAILNESGSGNNLHLKGLLIASDVVYKVGTIDSIDIAIKLRSIDIHLVTMYVECEVHDTTTVGNDIGCTCRIDAIPVHLIAHAVETRCGSCRHGKLRHASTDGVTIACS